jgi:hypothetical protein
MSSIESGEVSLDCSRGRRSMIAAAMFARLATLPGRGAAVLFRDTDAVTAISDALSSAVAIGDMPDRR